MSARSTGAPRPSGAALYDRTAIAERTEALGAAITADYSQRLEPGAAVVLVGVLRSCLPFLADLARVLGVEAEVDFLALSRFAPHSGRVRITRDLDIDITGRHVLLVEGIVDSGLSVGFLTGELRRRSPASVEVCTLLDRGVRRVLPLEVRYAGFTVDDSFLVGYGLDFRGRYGNLPDLRAVDRGPLGHNGDVYVDSLYGSRSAGGPAPAALASGGISRSAAIVKS
ncbi:MAG: phosphoribosyltransferase family protein [bacterium]|nr:phosphoribosyltransferase family protein [bacterium]MCY3924093.1 phosphoribosyltransferase family protein [bacterium]